MNSRKTPTFHVLRFTRKNMSRVRLVNISKHYGSTVAVEKVNLDVAEGELVTLLGPSGCGKTTTLRMIAGLIEPTAGRVYFDDQDVTNLPPNTRNIGFVFQSPALFPHMSVADNIGFGLSVKGRSKSEISDRVKEVLKLVDLVSYGNRLPRQLSGGQQQRVALARVLATDPRVLLFDEPLSALDRNLRETLKYNILELQRRTGKTAIYVTHDQSEAFAISDRIAVMNQGLIEQIGSQTEIYLHPQSDFVAEFIGANNRLEGQITNLSSEITTVQTSGLAVQCPTRVGLKRGDAVIAYIRPEDIKVLQNGEAGAYRNIVEGTLEQIIFEGATAQLRVGVAEQILRVDVAGAERLKLLDHRGQIRLGFNEVTLIPANN
jgi:ABC-type Fe3+/spermidine/putrescine transport system ATPase subunit